MMISTKFTINRWQHLYSLETTVRRDLIESGNRIVVEGQCEQGLNGGKTRFQIEMIQVSEPPEYKKSTQNQLILGTAECTNMQAKPLEVRGEVSVSKEVFSELHKNLVEYSGIDGILIQVHLGLDNETESMNIVTFDYVLRSQLDY